MLGPRGWAGEGEVCERGWGGGAGARRGGEQSDPGPREGWTVKLLPSSWAPPPLPIPPHAVSEILKIRVCLHCRLRKLQGEKLFEPFLFLILIHQEGGKKAPDPSSLVLESLAAT